MSCLAFQRSLLYCNDAHEAFLLVLLRLEEVASEGLGVTVSLTLRN